MVEGTDTLSTVVKADKEVEYAYLVCPKITVYGIDYYFSRSSYSKYNRSAKENFYLYKFIFDGAKINFAVANGTTIQLEWEKDLYVSSYEIYCTDSEESPFQLTYTENNAEKNSYVFTGEMGKTFYFKIVYIYPEERITSNERSSYIAGNNATKKTKVSLKQYAKEGQYYGGNWSSPDEAYYYQKNSKLHVVSRNKYSLIDCELDNNLKISSKKIIKLGKFANWGGFYYGTDGKYYVVVGDNNKKHSKKKVVIKVKQYSNDWHLLKTCNIKGDVSNVYQGITYPFDGGNCRMAMFNSTLYLFTCREMFSGHQSNISFAIDTNNMTYQLANEDYTSHSFNQFVKFDNGNLYLSNHGDAYARAVNLTMVTDYATPNANIQTILPFKIKGKCGDNYTGLMEGGMEVSASHVLIAGISVPQNYKVAGVSGNKHSYAKNVFLTVVNQSTGEQQVKWLTAYNPKKSKVEVGEVRLVKLSDEYIVLMYSSKKKNKSTLHYLVLNQNGEIVYSKNYEGMIFTGGTQPILYNGSIVWSDVKETYNKKSGKYKCTTYMYSIPAKVSEQ